MYFSNWIRNRLPNKRIKNKIPVLLWNANTRIDFSRVLDFGTKDFAFVCRRDTIPNKKFLPSTILGHFVGMESDAQLYRVYVPNTNKVIVLRKNYSKIIQDESLPGISALLDSISREIEQKE